MIEKIPLPLDLELVGKKSLPISNDLFHRQIGRKRDKRVQMVWHQADQARVPNVVLISEFD